MARITVIHIGLIASLLLIPLHAECAEASGYEAETEAVCECIATPYAVTAFSSGNSTGHRAHRDLLKLKHRVSAKARKTDFFKPDIRIRYCIFRE